MKKLILFILFSATILQAQGFGLLLNAITPSSYKVYTALLTQTGTNDPVPIVLENTLGYSITWIRSGVGEYYAITTESYLKVFCLSDWAPNPTMLGITDTGEGYIFSLSTSNVEISSSDASKQYVFVEIRVYP